MKLEQQKNIILYFLSALLFVLSISLAVFEDFRGYIDDRILHRGKRKVLSVLNYDGGSLNYKVVKLKNSRQIFIEIYNDKQQKQTTFSLGKKINGALFLNGRTTQLAAYDLDRDGVKEIVVPTIGQNNKSLLYILKYDAKGQSFSLESPVSYLK